MPREYWVHRLRLCKAMGLNTVRAYLFWNFHQWDQGRFWNIGPTQTMYVPGPWLKQGRNEVIVLDLLGPQEPVLAGREKPILDQEVRFTKPVQGRQFCLETLSAVDGKPFAAVAEIDLLDAEGRPIPHTVWTIAYVDSEERVQEDGSALNAINGQTADSWHTEWSQVQPGHPHRLVIDLGQTVVVNGFRYTPRAGDLSVGGRIKDYRVYVGASLARPALR